MRTSRIGMIAGGAAALALLATGCSGSAETAEPAKNETPAATIEAPAALAKGGQITYCSTLTNPPRAFVENGKNTGAEVELGEALAANLGLSVKWVQFRIDGIIPALIGEQCDMIVSQMKYAADREEIVWQLPSSIATTQLVVGEGNPLDISDFPSLSGHKVGAPNGSVAHDLLVKLNEQLKADGEAPVDIVPIAGTAELLQQVGAGVLDAAASTYDAGAYYVAKASGAFELAGAPCLSDVQTGGQMVFAIRKADDKLFHAMEKSMSALRESGEYTKIWESYGLEKATLDYAESADPVACLPE